MILKVTTEYLVSSLYEYYKEIRKIKFSQINLPVPASDKLKTMSKNFRYGTKNLKRG